MSSASDLLLHLRPCDLEIDFEQATYTLPAMDAVEWIALLDGPRPDLYEIFPVRTGLKAVEHVEDAMWEQRVSSDDVAKVALELIGLAADRPWWVALRTIAAARGSWSIVHVNSATGMSLAGWLDQVWSNIMTHIDPKKRAGWIAEVQSPPKGVDPEIASFDDEEKAFLAAMNAVMK